VPPNFILKVQATRRAESKFFSCGGIVGVVVASAHSSCQVAVYWPILPHKSNRADIEIEPFADSSSCRADEPHGQMMPLHGWCERGSVRRQRCWAVVDWG
jgi:hypothetical protein